MDEDKDMLVYIFFFFKQKTAYEIRPCDWSSDVCSSDLSGVRAARARSSAHAALSRAADARTAASSDSGSNRFRASSESAIACNWATWSAVQPSASRNPRIGVI